MDIQAVLDRASKALRGQKKEQVKDAFQGAMSLVNAREHDRREWQSKVEAAEQAAHQARGELEAAEINLHKAVSALEDLIAKGGEQ